MSEPSIARQGSFVGTSDRGKNTRPSRHGVYTSVGNTENKKKEINYVILDKC